MFLKSKRDSSCEEPEYMYSKINTPMKNYRVYVFNKKESFQYRLIGFLIGGIVGLLFYGGMFKDGDGDPTKITHIYNMILFIIVGAVAQKYFLESQRERLKKKRKAKLTQQFQGLLDSLSVSLSSGMNISDALITSYNDLKGEFTESAYIVWEVEEMVAGLKNNVPIEESIYSFGYRSEIEDVNIFATIFEMSYRAGGNIKDIVKQTNTILSEKIEVENEIQTVLTSNAMQFKVMMIMPAFMMCIFRMMGGNFSKGLSSASGVISITVAMGLFGVAYKMGSKIVNIGE